MCFFYEFLVKHDPHLETSVSSKEKNTFLRDNFFSPVDLCVPQI